MPLNWSPDAEQLRWPWTAATTILHKLGRPSDAQTHFDSLVEIGITENNFIQQAGVHAQLGDMEKVFDCLDVAFALRDPGLIQIQVDPFLDPLRDDPRFHELLRRVGFGND